MSLSPRLSLVTLGVADVARSTAFYTALGLVPSPAGDASVTFFNTDGAILALFGRQALADDAQVAADGSGFRGLSLAWDLPSPVEVDKAVVRMVAAGGNLVKQAEATFWGGYAGYVADPDGHLWELAHNPHFPIDAANRMRAPT